MHGPVSACPAGPAKKAKIERSWLWNIEIVDPVQQEADSQVSIHPTRHLFRELRFELSTSNCPSLAMLI